MIAKARESLLIVGNTRIPYKIRYSLKTERRRIEVTPKGIEVVVPESDDPRDIKAFVRRKREWVFNRLSELKDKESKIEQLTQYKMISGAKIPFRGRRFRLRIYPTEEDKVSIEYHNRFDVYRPSWASEDDLRKKMDLWLKNKLQEDMAELLEKYAGALDVNPGRVDIRHMKTKWGSCTKNGNIKLNLHLVHLSKYATEYVLVHELCHLRYPRHTPAFWGLVQSVLPEEIPMERRLEWALV